MSWLASLILYLIHSAYALATVVASWRKYYFAREPHPLLAQRSKVPRHVAILLASHLENVSDSFEQEILQNVEQVIGWCREIGANRLTLYDRQGILSKLSFDLRARILAAGGDTAACTSESELEYPLTPPHSDDSVSSSRSLSPGRDAPPNLHVTTLRLHELTSKRRSGGRGVVRRRTSRKTSDSTTPPLTIHVVSRESGKAAVAEVSSSLVREHRQSSSQAKPEDFRLSVSELNSLIECESGFPSPDLMLVHNITPFRQPKNVLELSNFPPWQISLTEFYYSIYPSSWWTQTFSQAGRIDTYVPLSQIDFRRALDQFAGAEMRLGK